MSAVLQMQVEKKYLLENHCFGINLPTIELLPDVEALPGVLPVLSFL